MLHVVGNGSCRYKESSPCKVFTTLPKHVLSFIQRISVATPEFHFHPESVRARRELDVIIAALACCQKEFVNFKISQLEYLLLCNEQRIKETLTFLVSL